MSYTFRIVFSGLCAFVPERPFETAGNHPRRALVLLRDLKVGLPLPRGEMVPPHVPTVSYDIENRRPWSTREPDVPGGEVVTLNGEDVKISHGGAAEMDIVDQQPADPDHPTPQEQRSLYFLARVEKQGGQVGKDVHIKPGLLESPPAPALLAGRVELTLGTLFTNEAKLEPWVAAAAAAGGGEPSDDADAGHVVANSLAFEIRSLDVDVTLVFKPYGGGPPRLLILGPAYPDQPLVKIQIQNKEPNFPALAVNRTREQNLDFRAYLGLLDGIDDTAVSPAPASVAGAAQPSFDLLSDGHPGGCTPGGILPPPTPVRTGRQPR